MRTVESIWNGNSAGDIAARTLLLPFEGMYHGWMLARGVLYDTGILETVQSPIPVISVGNLTVGGTGKTPVANWIARRLIENGARPAIILRGYGGDEILVHEELSPEVPVFVGKARPEAIGLAAARGASVAVLDDAFQHRRASRDADIVIVSADAWNGRTRLIPAGPWREPLSSIRRASLAIISRKASTSEHANEVSRAIRRAAPELPLASVRLRMSGFINVNDAGDELPLSKVAGLNVLAVSAIGDPGSFARQLGQLGAAISLPISFSDHHAFDGGDVARILERAKDYDIIICTLKDAVKLRSLWPASAPSLWYVSQSLDVETGAANIDTLLERFYPAK